MFSLPSIVGATRSKVNVANSGRSSREDLDQCVLELVLEINIAAANKQGVTMNVECPNDLESRFDASLVESVLHNFVGNASR